jgi:hypothetical protein
LVVSNFGGFVIGFLLALLGGALGISWGPARAAKQETGGGKAADDSDAPKGETAAFDAFGDASDDLSGTSPNGNDGTNGRHRAG